MEKITQRDEYALNFFEFCQKVKLTKEFTDALENHRYFKGYMKTVKKFNDDMNKKIFILLEFTRLRSTCEEMIKILRNTGQTEAADDLSKYNTSPGRMQESTDVLIKVSEAKAEMKGSLIYPMTKNPRGMCYIINNEPDLFIESKRFEHIFSQLFFEVKLYKDLTVKAICDKLEKLSKDKTLAKHEALIIMIISHGEHEKILGYNACQELDKNDLIEISKIVDIFSEKNCQYLRQSPKLFFFNCCRGKDNNQPISGTALPTERTVNFRLTPKENTLSIDLNPNKERGVIKLNFLDQKWIDENKDTFISYSCSEGNRTFYDENIGISSYGQALSHSIAQYACEESLQSILSRTCDFMDKFVRESYKSAPELRQQCMRRQLFFNPGIAK